MKLKVHVYVYTNEGSTYNIMYTTTIEKCTHVTFNSFQNIKTRRVNPQAMITLMGSMNV